MPALGPTNPKLPLPKIPGAKTSTKGVLKPTGPSTIPQRDLAAAPVAATPAPTAAYDYTGGVSGYSAPAPAVSEADYLATDKAYTATLAALDAALKQYEADIESQKKKYDVDYDTSLQTLGWKKPVGTEGAADFKPGDWNLTDQTTASGKSYQSQLGDFASRGLLQSSLYDRARGDLMNQLNKQRTSVETARTNFMDDLARQLASYKSEDTSKRQQARMESIANMAGSIV